MEKIDSLFILETHTNIKSLQDVIGFKCLGNPSPQGNSKHGGIAVYTRESLYDDVSDIRYSACTISFRLNSTPGLYGSICVPS